MNDLRKEEPEPLEDGEHERDDAPRYAAREAIEPMALYTSLSRLSLMQSDLFMPQQAFNLDIVDQFLLDLEYKVLCDYFDSERTPPETHFLAAQSEMWIFAAYELLRTWNQRARDIITWANTGGLKMKLDALKRRDDGYVHHGRAMLIAQLEEVIAHPELTDMLDRQRRHLHIPFARLEFIRVAIAKHEVGGRRNSIAYFPGYGRINMHCGSLDYELENGKYIIGTISRRDVADSIRALDLEAEPPGENSLKCFDAYMSGRDE